MQNEFMELARYPSAIIERVARKKQGSNGAVRAVAKSADGGNDAYFIEVAEESIRKRDYSDAAIEAGIRIKRLLRKHGITKSRLVLVAGIGNGGMTADSLGVRTLSAVKATEQLRPFRGAERRLGRVATVSPGVEGVTGVKSYGVIEAVCKRIGADAIIAVDTLACRQISRLARVIQITDAGIVPGSGVGNAGRALAQSTLGVPVIAIGVPLVIYARNIVAEYSPPDPTSIKELGDLVVTVKDVDPIAEAYAEIIGEAVNYAIHGTFLRRSEYNTT